MKKIFLIALSFLVIHNLVISHPINNLATRTLNLFVAGIPIKNLATNRTLGLIAASIPATFVLCKTGSHMKKINPELLIKGAGVTATGLGTIKLMYSALKNFKEYQKLDDYIRAEKLKWIDIDVNDPSWGKDLLVKSMKVNVLGSFILGANSYFLVQSLGNSR